MNSTNTERAKPTRSGGSPSDGGGTRPTVSVCMPVYRSERYIGAAIRSVLEQTFTDWELIVVDDCSPDRTFDIVRSFDDSRMRVSRNARNLGPEGNWNRVLAQATGRYIKLLPGDDTLYPSCLERQVRVLSEQGGEDIALVSCARDVIDRNGRKVLTARVPGHGRIGGAQLIRRNVRYGTNIIGEPGAVLFRADIARRIGGFDASLGYVIDLDYWLRLLRHGDGYIIPDALCTFRLSGENWSVELGRARRRHFLQFVDKISADRGPVTALDRAIGKGMARVNEVLRSLVYRWLLGIRASAASRAPS